MQVAVEGRSGMKVLWIFAHPEGRSLNGSLRDFGVHTLQAAGHEVRQSDLYAMRWKAVADREDFTDTEPAGRLIYGASSFRSFKEGTQAADVKGEQDIIPAPPSHHRSRLR